MLHPFLGNTARTVQYIFVWLAYALLQTFALYPIVALPFGIVVLDGFVHAVLMGSLGVLLWSVIQYGNYAILSVQQRIINYLALALLAISLWLGAGYGLFYWIYGEEFSGLLFKILPMRGFIGLLIYLLIIQRFRVVAQQTQKKAETVPAEMPQEVKPPKPAESELLERIAVKSGSKIHVVLIPDIIYLQADGDYVQIFTTDGKYLKEQTMKYFEEHLPDSQFVRVHRSVIVNVEMISRIELYEKQNQLLTLKNGQQIKTSPSGYKALRATLNL